MEISVILPFKDEAPYLAACLDSLARQTFRDFELIAVDDGSRDGSAGIVEAHAHLFTRCVLIENDQPSFLRALRLGIDHASGPVIARADGDDLYHPRRLEAQLDLIRSGADVAGCRVRFFPRNRLMGGFMVYENWINRLITPTAMAAECYVETPIAHPCLMIRRTLLERVGGYSSADWPEDFDLMLKAFGAGAVFRKTPEVLHFWREHPDRLCRTDPRYGLDAFIRCRCHHLVRGPLADGRALVLWGAGPIGRKTATALRREGRDFEAYIDIDPRKIGRTVRDRKVFGPDWLKDHRCFVLSCVGKRGARYLVRSDLQSMGYRERLDFILAA